MASERWWFIRWCTVYRVLLVVLVFALQSSLATEESDLSYYTYNVFSRAQPLADRSLYSSYVSDGEITLRKRRSSIEPLPVTTLSAQQQPVINANSSASDNVTYSTDNGTNSSVNDSSAVTSYVKSDVHNPKTVIVSHPMNPATGQPVVGTTWANETLSSNVTQDNKPDGKGVPDTTATSDIDDISISKFSDVTNKTLAQNNITKTQEDTHQYYNSTFIVDENIGKKFWIDMENHPDRKINSLLSQSHRRAATVKLSFDFPFYGHKVRNITIATGGFLYTGEYVHSWLAATQYIAPLMANFDTRLSPDSYVKYADNGTAFTVEWEKVVLQDKPNAGAFTFQATLHKNGDIVFVYSVVPLVIESIEDTAHPVKVGLSDAYIMDRTVFFVRRKTIYEYHRVYFNRQDIRNWTVIYLRALPTCLDMDNCNDCLTKTTEFECKWCPNLKRCSTGTFRNRQDWLLKGCEVRNIKEESSCPTTTTTYKEHDDMQEHEGHIHGDEELSASVEPSQQAKGLGPSEHAREKMNMGVSGIIGILIVVALIAGLAAWAAYAYRNPHSASGQMLIRYRPSQWSWRRGEARYTAATIHM